MDLRSFVIFLGPLSAWFVWEIIGLEGDFSDYPRRIVIQNRRLKKQIRQRRVTWLMAGNIGLGIYILAAVHNGF